MVKKGLVLVWDLDQTLIGWSADNRTYTFNSKAIEILKFAFKRHKDFSNKNVIKSIIILTNNSHPDIPVGEIEQKTGYSFDYVIERHHGDRDKTNPLLKDMDTVRRIVDYDVDPEDVWIMDDIKHQMVDEGANWIPIKTQLDNPHHTGFFRDNDETCYDKLLLAIDNYVLPSKGGKRSRTRRAKRRARKFDSRRYSL
jgi:hypothetical protein